MSTNIFYPQVGTISQYRDYIFFVRILDDNNLYYLDRDIVYKKVSNLSGVTSLSDVASFSCTKSPDFTNNFAFNFKSIGYSNENSKTPVLSNGGNTDIRILKLDNTSYQYIDEVFKLQTSTGTTISITDGTDIYDDYLLIAYQTISGYNQDGETVSDQEFANTFDSLIKLSQGSNVDQLDAIFLDKNLVSQGWNSVIKCLGSNTCSQGNCWGGPDCGLNSDGYGYLIDTLTEYKHSRSLGIALAIMSAGMIAWTIATMVGYYKRRKNGNTEIDWGWGLMIALVVFSVIMFVGSVVLLILIYQKI